MSPRPRSIPVRARRPRWAVLVGACLAGAVGVARADAPVSVSRSAGLADGRVAECAIAAGPAGGPLLLAGQSNLASVDKSLHLFRSTDDGRTWQLRRLGIAEDGRAGVRADPGLVFADARRLFLTYAVVDSRGEPSALLCARSRDAGATFERSVPIVGGVGDAAGDKPEPAFGRGRDGVEYLAVAYSDFAGFSGPPGVRLALSSDDGATFPRNVLVEASAEPTSYAQPAFGPDGALYVVFMRLAQGEAEVRLARSEDDGAHFAPSILLARTGLGFRRTVAAAPHRGIGVVPTLAVDASPAHRGRVYVCWVALRAGTDTLTPDTEVVCRHADAAARLEEMRWSAPIPVHGEDDALNFHPWLTLDPVDGRVAVLWHGTRLDPTAQTAVHTWLSVSGDGGATWAERRLSAYASDVAGQFGSAPSDYLEYIGVTVRDGLAHAAWAGRARADADPRLPEYLYARVALDDVLAGHERKVPDDYPDVARALAAADAGDRVVVDGTGGPIVGGFRLARYVGVSGRPGTGARLVAGGPEPLVRAAPDYVGPGLRGLALAAGAGPVIELPAAIDATPAGAAPVASWPALPVIDCALAAEDVALRSRGLPVRLEGCRVQAGGAGVELHFDDRRALAATRVAGNRFLVDTRGPEGGVGLSITVRGVGGGLTVDHNTFVGGTRSVRVVTEAGDAPAGSSPGGCELSFHHNLLLDFLREPLELRPGPGGATLITNFAWNDAVAPGAGWAAGADTWRDSTGVMRVAPRLCGEAPEPLALRVDSPLAEGNCPGGRVGALDVGCAEGPLTRSTTVAPGVTLRLAHDLVVPPGLTLTLRPGVTLAWRTAAGAPAPRLRVFGTLRARGEPGRPVALARADGAARPWGGIEAVGPDARLDLRHAHVTGAVTGLRLQGGAADLVDCVLADHDSAAFVAGPAARRARLVDCRVDVSRGVGINAAGPLELLRCGVEGNARARAGVWSAPGGALRLRESAIEGFAAGEALRLSGPRDDVDSLVATRFSGNDVALRLEGGTPDCAAEEGAFLRGCAFAGNGDALWIGPGAARPDLGTAYQPGDNLFAAPGRLCIRNDAAACGVVSALGNRFEGADPYACMQPPESVHVGSGTPALFEPGCVDAGAGDCRPRLAPNPFHGTLHIEYVRPSGGRRPAAIEVTDVTGRRVRRWPEDDAGPGVRTLEWDGRDDDGRPLPAGFYWVTWRRPGQPPWSAKVLKLP